MSSSTARKTFEIENNIVTDDTIYTYDEVSQKEILKQSPWKGNPNYFTNVKISAIALLRMAIHARSGKNIEIMGVMTGKIIGREFIVMDAYPLPVEGTETRVNALGEAYEYMVEYLSSLQGVGRQENIVGWYHSHPGYGCWLSGIDVGTQAQNQQFQDPFLAIVVDPNRTISAGKVDIGAFRTYPPEYVASRKSNGSMSQDIPIGKLEDFGVHAAKYYALKVSYFKSSLDSQVLEVLWNKYWTSTLAQSSLNINHDYTTAGIIDLATKTEKLVDNKDDSETHQSSLFNEQIHRLGTMIRNRKGKSEKGSTSTSTSTSPQTPLAIEQVTNSAVKIGSEEIQGLISREIKKSVLQISK